MHISILTASGKYNLWDELILKQEYETLKKAFPGATFSIFTYDKKSCLIDGDDIEFVSFFPNKSKEFPVQNTFYLIKNIFSIAKSDLVVIGWGGLLYDRETQANMFPLMQWLFRVLIAKLFRVPIVWWAVGINLSESTPKQLLSLLFSGKKTLVTVRDPKSRTLLESAWISCQILPDPVLSYRATSTDKHPDIAKKIGISLRTGYTKDESIFITEMLEYFREKNFEIIFLSQSIHPEDANANDALFAKQFALPGETVTKSLQDTLDTYKTLDYVVGMRLHSLILAAVHAIPFVALSYETKTRELLSSLEYSYALDTKTASSESFIELFESLMRDGESVKFDLMRKNDTIRELSIDSTRKLISKIRALLG